MKTKQDFLAERKAKADGIITTLKTHAPTILAQYPVDIAYIHGSVARGQPMPTSDIDIAVILSTVPADPYQRTRLELKIQAAVEDTCGLSEIDLRAFNHASLMVQGRILQEGILLYERDKDQRVAFEAFTRNKYIDFLPIANTLRQAYFKRIREKGFKRG